MTSKTAPVPGLRAGPLPRPAQALFALLAHLRFGGLEVRGPDGRVFSFHGASPGPDAHLHLEDWQVCADVLRSGDIGFAESYLAGRWSTPDLPALLALAAVNNGALEDALNGRWWGKLAYRLRHLLRANTRAGACRNIHSHYDIGNEFYARWLDRTMTYSSAQFDGDYSRSLEEAQLAKYERILGLLDPRPGQSILEIGCGWGGFAEHAARTRGCRVHGITLSRQFNRVWGEIEPMGFDQRFRRLWNFYLAYCEAGFRAGTTDVLQMELTHA